MVRFFASERDSASSAMESQICRMGARMDARDLLRGQKPQALPLGSSRFTEEAVGQAPQLVDEAPTEVPGMALVWM